MDQESPLLSPHQTPGISSRFPAGLSLPPLYTQQSTEGPFSAHHQPKATTTTKRAEHSPEVGKSALFSAIPACPSGASLIAQAVKNTPVNAGDIRDVGLVPEWGRSSGGGNGKLAWEIPRTEEPGGLQPVGLQGVGHCGAHKHMCPSRKA